MMIEPTARRALVVIILAVTAVVTACSDGGDRFPAPSEIHMGEGGHTSKGPTRCTDGDTRACHVVLGQQGQVVSCYDGEQECVDGGWGDCIDPTVESSSD